MARTKLIILWLAASAALVPVLAAGDRAVTLDEAVAQSLARHPAVLQAQQGVEAAGGRSRLLGALSSPELTFQSAGLDLWGSGTNQEFSLGLRQQFEFPGKRGLRRDIGKSGEDQAGIELERTKNLVRIRVEKAYFEAASAERRLSVLGSVLATLKEYSELAAERYKNGQTPYLDLVRGRLETLRVQNEIVEGRRELKEKTAALLLSMGEGSYEPLTFPTEIGFSPLGRSWEELKERALDGSTLRLANNRSAQAGLAASLAKKSRLPDFTFGLYGLSKKLGSWGFEIELTLPFLSRGPGGAAIETEALSRQAATSAQGQTLRVLFALEKAYADAKALEEQIGLFRDSLIRDVEEALKASLDSYQYGKSDALGVLDIVRSLKEVRAEYLRALLNHRLALIEIAAAGEEDGLETGPSY
jgi:cobalt-zinc-cadmium efflux system outer membrane protein